MVTVKICGVRTVEAAAVCAEMSVDFAGLNFVSGARREVSIECAKYVRKELDKTCAVGVFRNASRDELLRTVGVVGLDAVQLHGDESPETCAWIRERGVRVIKALPVTLGADARLSARIAEYGASVDVLLLDAPVPGAGIPWFQEMTAPRYLGGTPLGGTPLGRLHDRPLLFVAGGLTPNNVAAAIQTLTPNGVDVASGVESAGEIDSDKIRAFCSAVRTTAFDRITSDVPPYPLQLN